MKPRERKLLNLFDQLSNDQQQSLLDYAEFLSQRQSAGEVEQKEVPQPVIQARPEQETVVAAIKRLTVSYPMLDRDKLFNQTSVLMTQHIMQGREAVLVIDDMELLFKQHYDELVASWNEK